MTTPSKLTKVLSLALALSLPAPVGISAIYPEGIAAVAKSAKAGGKAKQPHGKTARKTTRAARAAGHRAAMQGGAHAEAPLAPSQKGKWNAAHANQHAFDAHIRNGNFNGTIGALAQYQLALKAASGAELSEAEQAALDSFLSPTDGGPTDEQLAAYLNDGALDGQPIFAVVDGVVTCAENCPTDPEDLASLVATAQAVADEEAARLAQDARDAALDAFVNDTEARIGEDSNKALSETQFETLLDELAAALGQMRLLPDDETLASDPAMEPMAMGAPEI